MWIKRIERKRPRVVCYWNTSEVKEEKLIFNMKERTRKISQTMQLTKQKTECVGVLAFTSSHNQKEDNNQSEINKQPEAPENQNAWNSNNKGIKEKIKQNNQASKVTDCLGWLRKTSTQQTLGARPAASAGCVGGADVRGLRGGCGLRLGLPW